MIVIVVIVVFESDGSYFYDEADHCTSSKE